MSPKIKYYRLYRYIFFEGNIVHITVIKKSGKGGGDKRERERERERERVGEGYACNMHSNFGGYCTKCIFYKSYKQHTRDTQSYAHTIKWLYNSSKRDIIIYLL